MLDSFKAYSNRNFSTKSENQFIDLLYKKSFYRGKDEYIELYSKNLSSQMRKAKDYFLFHKVIQKHPKNYSTATGRCNMYRFTQKGYGEIRIEILREKEEINKKFYKNSYIHKWIYDCFYNISVKREPLAHEHGLILIQNRKLWINHKGESSRIYSSITNLERESRNAIQLYGKDLIKLDIKSAQPYFLAKLSGDEKLLEICSNAKKDIYKGFGVILGIDSRETAKNALLQALFDLDSRFYRQPVWNALEQHFRAAYEYAKAVKRDDYSELSRVLEREEVIFMWKVWKLLAVEKIPFLTIHDCLMVFPEDENRVRDIFEFVGGNSAPYLKKEV